MSLGIIVAYAWFEKHTGIIINHERICHSARIWEAHLSVALASLFPAFPAPWRAPSLSILLLRSAFPGLKPCNSHKTQTALTTISTHLEHCHGQLITHFTHKSRSSHHGTWLQTWHSRPSNALRCGLSGFPHAPAFPPSTQKCNVDMQSF